MSDRVRRSLPALCSLFFALAGTALLLRALHHPERTHVPASPLLALALLIGAWDRLRSRR